MIYVTFEDMTFLLTLLGTLLGRDIKSNRILEGPTKTQAYYLRWINTL